MKFLKIAKADGLPRKEGSTLWSTILLPDELRPKGSVQGSRFLQNFDPYISVSAWVEPCQDVHLEKPRHTATVDS